MKYNDLDYVDACDREAFARLMEECDDLEDFMNYYDDDFKLLTLDDPIDS